VIKTLTVTTLADLTVALADRDLLEMDPPVQVKSVIFLSGHFFYEILPTKCNVMPYPCFHDRMGSCKKEK